MSVDSTTHPDLTVYDGKYRFFVPDGDYRIHVHRYGEPWIVIEQGAITAHSYAGVWR